MRIPVGAAERGSQRWVQRLVNRAPHLIDEQICPTLRAQRVIWRSPLATDDYAEYRDQSALDRVGVTLRQTPLNTFWPRRGPVWDGLALDLLPVRQPLGSSLSFACEKRR